MIKRANYVALVWKECGASWPDLPALTSHGWSQDGDRLQAILTTLLPAPKAVLELVKCGCKGNCITMSCSCKSHNLKCTDMCVSCEAKQSVKTEILRNSPFKVMTLMMRILFYKLTFCETEVNTC